MVTAAAALAACSITEPRETEVRMWVAADSVDCFGAFGPQRCLSVRELEFGGGMTNWHPLYQGIEGFSHEPLFEYELIVMRREISNPPADGSSILYRLHRIVDRTPVD